MNESLSLLPPSPIRSRWTPILTALLVAMTAAACSSSKETTDEGTYHLAAFEDFNEDEHPDVIPPPPPEITDHDIPDELAAPGVDAPPSRVRGYRVQLFSTRNKSEADAELQRAITWWEADRADENVDQPPIYVEYEQPYYKVRLGDYRTRQAAAGDAETVSQVFKGAFVVPAIVNVR